jgi:hypothetical protein
MLGNSDNVQLTLLSFLHGLHGRPVLGLPRVLPPH